MSSRTSPSLSDSSSSRCWPAAYRHDAQQKSIRSLLSDSNRHSMHRIHFSRREFCAIAGSTIASLAIGSACKHTGGSVIVSDGRLTARPRNGVKTSATGEIKLGLDSERDAVLQIPKNAGQSPLPL